MRLALLLALAVPLSAGGNRPMNKRVSEVAARLAPTWVLPMHLNESHTFETRNLSKGSDTVLLILDDEKPLAWNDDRDPLPTDRHYVSASLLKFTAPRRAPYSVQVRAKPGTLPGTCDLYRDDKLFARSISFGAPHKYIPGTPMEMPRPLRPAKLPLLDTYELEHPVRSPAPAAR